MTDEQKQQALHNAIDAQNARIETSKHIRHNSFESWGNDKCIRRLDDTIEAMEQGNASNRQYAYWLKH